MTKQEAIEVSYRSNLISEKLRENKKFFPVKISKNEWKVANCVRNTNIKKEEGV